MAGRSGNSHLLGCKGACLKTPAEFSTRTDLIENRLPAILDERSADRDQVDKAFEQVEALLSGPIVQHNLDKYQRLLIGREEQRKLNKRGSDGRIINPPKRKILTKDLPELEHAFLEGIQV